MCPQTLNTDYGSGFYREYAGKPYKGCPDYPLKILSLDKLSLTRRKPPDWRPPPHASRDPFEQLKVTAGTSNFSPSLFFHNPDCYVYGDPTVSSWWLQYELIIDTYYPGTCRTVSSEQRVNIFDHVIILLNQ